MWLPTFYIDILRLKYIHAHQTNVHRISRKIHVTGWNFFFWARLDFISPSFAVVKCDCCEGSLSPISLLAHTWKVYIVWGFSPLSMHEVTELEAVSLQWPPEKKYNILHSLQILQVSSTHWYQNRVSEWEKVSQFREKKTHIQF